VCPRSPHLCDSALTPIGICPRKFTRKLLAACLVAAALAVTGCGGDDDSAATAPTTAQQTDTTPVVTTPTETETEAKTETAPTETTPATPTDTSPEEQPGGAGDEEPARTLALFTARGGRIEPRVVRVPPFISVQVQLRAPEGGDYALRFGPVVVKAGEAHTFDGLRPGGSRVGLPIGEGNRVTVSATAEPGP
jgi:hypothetical protein